MLKTVSHLAQFQEESVVDIANAFNLEHTPTRAWRYFDLLYSDLVIEPGKQERGLTNDVSSIASLGISASSVEKYCAHDCKISV